MFLVEKELNQGKALNQILMYTNQVEVPTGFRLSEGLLIYHTVLPSSGEIGTHLPFFR